VVEKKPKGNGQCWNAQTSWVCRLHPEAKAIDQPIEPGLIRPSAITNFSLNIFFKFSALRRKSSAYSICFRQSVRSTSLALYMNMPELPPELSDSLPVGRLREIKNLRCPFDSTPCAICHIQLLRTDKRSLFLGHANTTNKKCIGLDFDLWR